MPEIRLFFADSQRFQRFFFRFVRKCSFWDDFRRPGLVLDPYSGCQAQRQMNYILYSARTQKQEFSRQFFPAGFSVFGAGLQLAAAGGGFSLP